MLAVLTNRRRTRREDREKGEELRPGGFFGATNVKAEDCRKEEPERNKDSHSKAMGRRKKRCKQQGQAQKHERNAGRT